jgi:exonuclease SbcC
VAVGAAVSVRDDLARVLIQTTELDKQIAQVEPLALALDALHRHLGDAKFKKFATERKQDKLLGVATSILRRMTNDRYGFGADLRIVDRSASQARSPETLSGGEKFLASLALALALVEIASRSGRHFGALFLDEGFGSLDPQALDEVLSELERQAGSGRIIGVITHVASVVEYIDDVLRVGRTPAGSQVIRVGADELETSSLASAGPV